jgi:hypothetical protein
VSQVRSCAPKCALFRQWLPTAGYAGTQNTSLPGDTSLLNQAIADAHNGEFSSQSSIALSTDLEDLPCSAGRPRCRRWRSSSHAGR